MSVKIGDDVPEWVMPSVKASRMRTMAAILRDPYPVHWDRKAVAKLGLGERTINQGPLGLSYMVNMLHAWAGEGCLRRLVMTFPLPVFEEEHITARGKVTDVRHVDGEMLVDCDVWLEREGTPPPLKGTATIVYPGAAS